LFAGDAIPDFLDKLPPLRLVSDDQMDRVIPLQEPARLVKSIQPMRGLELVLVLPLLWRFILMLCGVSQLGAGYESFATMVS
jgi:hypothetical protein